MALFCRHSLLTEDELAQLLQPPVDRNAYLKKRWLLQLQWWECRSREARWKYYLSRWIVIVGGASIPFLTLSDFKKTESFVALLIAAAAAVEALHNWGGIWLEKRKATEILKSEGWRYLLQADVYKDQKTALDTFVTNVENKIVAEVGEYASVARPDARNRQATPGEGQRRDGRESE